MKIAGVQMNVALGRPEANLEKMLERLRETRAAGAELTVFPECAVAGYCYQSPDEATPYAEPVPGPATERFSQSCSELGGYAVFGMIEQDGERLFNTAVLVGGEGVIGTYRKVHLPYLGVDMFTTPGDRPFAVETIGEVALGMNICYDSAFPEAARALSLLGADLIALPTNWPPGAEVLADHCINARAMENGVYYIAVNRVGTERGFEFIGRSSICSPTGQTLAKASDTAEETIYAQLDLQRARNKHYVRVPGKHEINRLADRRPEMYGLLTVPHNLPTPREQTPTA